MEEFKVADLSEEELMRIEQLENELGKTLIAYEPEQQTK